MKLVLKINVSLFVAFIFVTSNIAKADCLLNRTYYLENGEGLVGSVAAASGGIVAAAGSTAKQDQTIEGDRLAKDSFMVGIGMAVIGGALVVKRIVDNHGGISRKLLIDAMAEAYGFKNFREYFNEHQEYASRGETEDTSENESLRQVLSLLRLECKGATTITLEAFKETVQKLSGSDQLCNSRGRPIRPAEFYKKICDAI